MTQCHWIVAAMTRRRLLSHLAGGTGHHQSAIHDAEYNLTSRLLSCPARASVRCGYLIGLVGPVTGAMVRLHHRLRARAKVRGGLQDLQDKAGVRA
jgi:hypothetical protein